MTEKLAMPFVSGKNGIVASASPLASSIGLKVLMDGGNAVDAAIATAAMLSVDEPYFSSIGGHGILMLYLAATKEVKCLDFGGFFPAEFTLDQLGIPPEFDSLDLVTSIFPGMLAGWSEVLEKYGTRDLGKTLEPTIKYAEDGVPVRPLVSEFIENAFDERGKFPEFSKIFVPEGRVPRVGEIIRYEDLAKILRSISVEGVDLFYQGEIADRIVAYYNSNGSRFTKDEFSSYKPRWRESLSTTYRDDYQVIVPKCQVCSPVILSQLNIWENFDMQRLGVHTPEALHVGIEAAKIAAADRKTYCGDPDFSDVPYEQLISKAYGKRMAGRIDREKAAKEMPGNLADLAKGGGTTHLTVVDKDGNAVAITQTIGPDFGGLHVVPGTGIILNNEGVYFDLEPVGGPNYPAGGKLSQHDMSPTVVLKDGELFLALGTPGGTGISQTIPQIIVKVIDHGLGIQEAIESDRYRYCDDGGTRLGEGIPADVHRALREMGHRILPPATMPIWAGGFNAIMVDPQSGAFMGGSDPRRGGMAAGY
jgi:gamma-glutamyltranspeptidase/glutathione hydrolase